MSKEEIPWLKVTLEAVTIVVSILLAFGVQAWWERAQDRDDEHEVLLGLHRDFEDNRTGLSEVIAYVRQLRPLGATIDSTLALIEGSLR